MELRHLRYFLAVAEELHFGRAAERLNIAQPPLSQQIRRLEEELGVLLFQRTKRRVQLTEVGQVFLEEARRTLAQADQARRAVERAARGEVGRLVVGFVDSAAFNLLPVILRAFRERFPSVELVLQEMATVHQVQALHDRQIHIGFVRPPVNDATLHFETISREPYLVALPSAHPLARQPSVELKALAGEPFIFPPQAAVSFSSHIMEICRQAGFTPRIAQEAVRTQTLVSLVAGGMGVALVPASVSNLRRTGVVYRPIQQPTRLATLRVAWRRDDDSPVLKSFLAVVREVARKSPRLLVPTVGRTRRTRRSPQPPIAV